MSNSDIIFLMKSSLENKEDNDSLFIVISLEEEDESLSDESFKLFVLQ